MNETILTARIMAALRARGIYVVKYHGSAFSTAGVPDLLCCADGKLIAMEIKVQFRQPTPIQEVQIAKIRAAGGVAVVVRSVEEALAACMPDP